jgi:hypothetical protein
MLKLDRQWVCCQQEQPGQLWQHRPLQGLQEQCRIVPRRWTISEDGVKQCMLDYYGRSLVNDIADFSTGDEDS